MTIHLPNDLESSIQAAVHSGRFASVDEAMTAAARLLLREISQQPPSDAASQPVDTGLGSIGAMRDDADILDQAVEHAMRVREERPWRLNPVE
jgi:Arc/MetJ-type ribon-helix-helix transcriptional regulator